MPTIDTFLTNFHFLRPEWLLALPVIAYLHYLLIKMEEADHISLKSLPPHLSEALTVTSGATSKANPKKLISCVLVALTLIIAGPSWEKIRTPFTEDKAPLVIALELTETMLADDQPPYRLERAKHKIRDLLKARKGAQTALIVYSGSAHIVLPLTNDTQLVEIYLDSLHPHIMPREGDAAGKAYLLAQDLLGKETYSGSILFLTDGFPPDQVEQFQSVDTQSNLLFLTFGNAQGGFLVDDTGASTDKKLPALDINALELIQNETNAKIINTSVDDTDISTLMRHIESHLVNNLDQDENLDWADNGYPFTWLLLPLVLLWFRRGWTTL